MSDQERVLLIFLAAGADELDPVRIQKGLFILGQKAPRAWLSDSARYQFEPYDYGPFAKQIYGDLYSLRRKGYVKTSDSWNPSWRFYSATDAGRERAQVVSQSLNPRLLDYLAAVRTFVSERSFSDLLDAVYQEFPEYAVNSVFRR